MLPVDYTAKWEATIDAIESEAATLGEARLAAALTDDRLGHALDEWLAPGAVAPTHNIRDDGEPYGDCYKCRRITEALRAYLFGDDNDEVGFVIRVNAVEVVNADERGRQQTAEFRRKQEATDAED
jgi:hypothetical protein